MVRPQTVSPSAKLWIPKDAVTKITEEWLLEDEMNRLLSKLCGVWKDTKGSSYTLTRSTNGDKLDVATERPNGVVHKTGGLIQVEWDDLYGRIVWGRGGRSRQYTIRSFDGNTLIWRRGGSPDFQWSRVGDVDESSSEIDELEVETTRDNEFDDDEHSEVRHEAHYHRAKLRREFQRKRREAEALDEEFPNKTVDGCEAGRKILAALQASKENVQGNAAQTSAETTASHLHVQSNHGEQRNQKRMDKATAILLDALKISPKETPSQCQVPNLPSVEYASVIPSQPPAMLPLVQMPMYQYPLTPVDVTQVTAQVEYWFSDENLGRDSYMRSLMNENGWVYLGTLQDFRRLQQMHVDIWALRFALIPSVALELDGSAQYVRIRDQLRRERWAQVARNERPALKA
jgi:hypothetical protein